MTWLLPWALAAGALGAVGAVLAHLLSRHRPPEVLLPTARFVRRAEPSAATRVAPPSDRLLLATRLLALLLAAVAVARPVREPARGSVARVVALDRSRDVADHRAAAESARALLRPGDRLVTFDSAARPVPAGGEAGALASTAASRAAGSLSAAMAASARVGAALARRADSVELVLVTPAVERAADAATDSLQAAWPGRVRLVRVAARADSVPSGAERAVSIRGGADDPLRATFTLAGLATAGDARVRVVRDSMTAADSAWAAGDSGRVLVVWEAGGGWGEARDPIGAVATVGSSPVVVVAPFGRRREPRPGRVVARWVDGIPAATERPFGAGCVRRVGVPVERVGDLALRGPMRDFARAMTAPCADRASRFDTATLRPGREQGPLASARALLAASGAPPSPSRLPALLLAASLLLLLAELPLRRRAARPS